MLELIISLVALVCSVIALFLVYKRKNKTEIVHTHTKEVIYPPIEHPFIYDQKLNCYTLIGDLKVNGTISALNKEEE